MKRINSLFVILLLVSCIVSCGNDTNEDSSVKGEPQHYSIDAKSVWFDTLEEMEAYSELIVRVERLDEEEAVISTVNGKMVLGCTFSQVEIKEIFQDTEERYTTGDVITILENEVYDVNQNIVYHIANYNMMKVGNEYLLFLHYAKTDGREYYVASGVNLGTISLENDGRERTYVNQSGEETGDYSAFQDMWEEALEKYIK